MRLLFYQHGNFLETLDHYAAGKPEYYRDQKVSVTFIQDLGQEHDVTVIAMCGEDYDVRHSGLRIIGMADRVGFDTAKATALLAEVRPERLVTRGPHSPLLRAAARSRIPTLPCLADIFERGGLQQFVRLRRLRRLLQGPHIPCVANHSLNASRALVTQMGLPGTKVVPWDWSRLPVAPEPKRAAGQPFRIVYAGGLREVKGVGDVMEAMALADARGVKTALTVAGRGDIGPWQEKADGLGIDFTYIGVVAHAEVGSLMAASDAVLVPSRHNYPEGLPNTIYEGLAARSPVILSDHPSFLGRLKDREEALFFEGGNPASLAEKIAALATDPALYARLSENAPTAVEGLYVGMEWSDLVAQFLADPANDTGWVAPNSMTGLGLA